MTVVAWDGKQVAVDRQITHGNLVKSATKWRRLIDGRIATFTGYQENGIALINWLVEGADPQLWPEFQKEKDWTQLLVFGPDGAFEYEQLPIAKKLEMPFFAWGSGRNVALGALSMGANARIAVETACRWITDCGMGVDYFDL